MTLITRGLVGINFGGSKKIKVCIPLAKKRKAKMQKKQFPKWYNLISESEARLPSLWPVFTSRTWRPFQKGLAKFKAREPYFNIKM